MENKAMHAVLADGMIYMIAQSERKLVRRSIPQASHISHLYAIGRELGITHFWIMPNCDYDRLAYKTLADREEYNIFYTTEKDGTRFPEPRAARIRRNGIWGEILVCYPARHRWSWDIKRPLDILACIDYLERELGITVQWSPGHMSVALMKKENATENRKKWIRESTMDLSKLPFHEAARPLKLRCALTENMAGLWLHNYDKNSAYLGAAQGLTLGSGDPVHVTRNIDIKLPGVYRVMITGQSRQWDGRLPPIIDREWVTSDILHFALEQGFQVEALEAWQFPEHHQLLREWAADLWNARVALNPENLEITRFPYAPGRANAYKSIKKIATLGGGRFAMNDVEHDLMRPDWWWQLVGKGRVNGLRNLKRFAAAGARVWNIDNDAMTFVSPDPDYRTAVPGILDREGNLGGYKHEWSLLLTEEIVREVPLMPGRMLSYLTAKGMEQSGVLV